MARLDVRRAGRCARIVGAFLVIGAAAGAGGAAGTDESRTPRNGQADAGGAQPPVAQVPTTQPTSRLSASERMRRLNELRQLAERRGVVPPASQQGEGAADAATRPTTQPLDEGEARPGGPAPTTQPAGGAGPAQSPPSADGARGAEEPLDPEQVRRQLEEAARAAAERKSAEAEAPSPGLNLQPATPADQDRAARREELRRRAQDARRNAERRRLDREVGRPSDADRAQDQPATQPAMPDAGGESTAQEAPRPPSGAEAGADAEERPVRRAPASEPADGRTEWFNFTDMPWEDVVRHYARRIGKPLIEDEGLVIGGTLTYVNPRRFTKQEAIDELNYLLHRKGLRFVETEHHIYVVELSEMPGLLDIKDTYFTREAFEAADVRDMDYVAVYFKIKDKPAQEILDTFASALPDYARMSEVGDTNQIKLVALAKDLRRFFELYDRIGTEPSYDPRQIRIFSIQSNVRDIERMLQEIEGVGGGTSDLARLQALQRLRGRGVQPPQPEEPSASDLSNVQMTADERTNSLVVKGTPAQLERIGKFIEEIDKKPPIGEFDTKVIEIRHASAVDVANALTQIFQQEQGQDPAWQRLQALRNAAQRRTTIRTPQGVVQQPPQNVNPADVLGESIFERAKKTIRVVPFERTNSIIVYANEEGHLRVAKMLETLDTPLPSNFKTIALEHADAQQVYPTVSQLAQALAASRGGTARMGAGGQAVSVTLDPVNNAFHVFAEREDMQQIEQIIRKLDVEPVELPRHVIELVNLTPTRVAQMIQPLLEQPGGGAAPGGAGVNPMRRGRRFAPGAPTPPPGGAGAGGAAQVIPLDEARILIVFCDDETWAKVEETIRVWDAAALTSTPQVRTIPVTRGDAGAIVATLERFYRFYEHPTLGRSTVEFTVNGSEIMARGVKPALEEVAALVEAMDREDSGRLEILPLAHADATDVAQQAQALFVGRGPGGPRAPGGAAPTVSIQAEPATNALIVQADGPTLEKIKNFAMEMDQKIGAQQPQRKFYTLRYADPREAAQAIGALFGGGAAPRGRGAPSGSRVTAMASGPQVVVEAPAGKLTEIDAFIAQLDDPGGREIVIKTIKLPGADVSAIASRLGGAFRERQRTEPNTIVRFDADPSSETILLTCSKAALEEAEKLIDEYRVAYSGQETEIKFRKLENAAAAEAAPWLQAQLVAAIEKTGGRGAASQIKVSADPRTNRVIINAPRVAVEMGLGLLEQYDVAFEDPNLAGQVGVKTVKMPGLDVRNLASLIQNAVNNFPPRPDKLRISVSADPTTETLIVSAPNDAMPKLDELIAQFSAESEKLTPEQRFVQVVNADANYVATKVRELLNVQIGRKFGSDVAGRVSISVDERLNRLVINAPRMVLSTAESLVAELDMIAATSQQIETLGLENADAATVVNILNTVLRDKISKNRTLQISAEPMTNSIIATGRPEDLAEIRRWAGELDAQAVTARGELRVFELKNGNPWEIVGILNNQFAARRAGQRSKLGQEVTFAVVGGGSIVAQAPADRMGEIAELVDRLDAVGTRKVEVRTYELPGIGEQIQSLAREITNAFNAGAQAREQRISVTPYPDADTLIVTALSDQFEEIEQLMERLKGTFQAEKTITRFIELKHLNAGEWAPQIKNMVANRLARDATRSRRAVQNFDVLADARTNRLICYVPEKIAADLDEVIAQLDVPPRDDQGRIRTVELAYADANTVAGILNGFFADRSAQRSRIDASRVPVRIVAEPITNALLVTAADEDFEQIRAKAVEIDEGAVLRRSDPVLITLEHADPNSVVTLVREVYKDPSAARGGRGNPQNEVNVQPVGGAAVLVQAPRDKLEKVRQTIAELDRADATLETPAELVELHYLDANQVRGMIQEMFASRARGSSAAQEVKVSVAGTGVVVKGPAAKVKEIKELIGRLDAESPGLDVKTYSLKVLDASQTALGVQMALRSMGVKPKPGQMQPGAFAEPTTNTLIVMADKSIMPWVDGLIAQLEMTQRPVSEPRVHDLTHVRADQVAANLDAMLKAKVVEREGQRKQQQVYTAVQAVPGSNRLIVFAPAEYHELAAQLVKLVDEEVESGEIVEIIPLERADATELARTVTDVRAARASARGGQPDVKVVADTGSNSLLVTGLARDVGDVAKLVRTLEESSSGVPELQIIQLQNASALDVSDALKALFPQPRNPADAVTVTADEYYNRLIVSASRRKMRQVEAYVQQFDAPPAEGEGLLPGNREIHIVDVYRANADDIVWEIEDYFPPADKGGPSIEADWFGEYIKVVCRPNEFPQIERLIRDFDARAKPELKVEIRRIKGNLPQILAYLQAQNPDMVLDQGAAEISELPSIIETLWGEDETPPFVKEKEREREKKRRQNNGGAQPAYVDLAFGLAWMSGTIDWDGPQDAPPTERESPAAAAAPQETPAAPPVDAQSASAAQAQAPAQAQAGADRAALRREPARITRLPDGRIVITGPKTAVEDLSEAIDVLEEDIAPGEVIRIFKFRFGDVTAAAQILERMFNERAIVQIPQMGQQPGQQRGGRDQRGRGEGGEGEEGRAQPGGMAQQIQQLMAARQQAGAAGGRAGGQRVRIATDPGHSYLIVKCDESDLPEIRQLLRELDIPPGEVDINVIQLKNIDASETAQNLKEVLGIVAARERGQQRVPQLRGFGGGAIGGPQQQLLEVLTQQMVAMTVGGEEIGAKIESVQIVPNTVTNSLMISAPPDVMTIVRNVINDLEELEGREIVVIRHYPLQNARVDDVLPLLEEVFSAAGGAARPAAGGEGGRGARRGGGSPASLGPVTVSGDPRSNTIIYTAMLKDVEDVERQIRTLDIEGPFAEAETYVCRNGDAAAIAAAVEAIFVQPGAAGGPRGRGAPQVSDVRIVAESSTNTIIVWASPEKRDLVFSKIEELDNLSDVPLRDIPVAHADPEKLADKLNAMFAGPGGAAMGAAPPGARRGRAERGGGAAGGRVVILGDKAAGKILVRAPENVYRQILSLVQVLDQPDEQLQIRRFELRYANANDVVESVKQAIQEYIALGRLGGSTDFALDPFTAVPDARTNSIMVVGSTKIFGFVQTLLAAVDVETPDSARRVFRIFVLRGAEAQTVADAINAFVSGIVGAGRAPGGGPGARGGRGGLGALPAAGAAGGMGRELDVQAVAEPASNTVMLYGREEDILTVAERIIDPFEQIYEQTKDPVTIPVQHAPASQVASFIQQFLATPGAAVGGGPRGGAGAPQTGGRGVQIVPNDAGKSIIVAGPPAEVELVRKLVEKFDDPAIVSSQVKVIAIPRGQDAAALARELERIINESERSMAQQTGRRPAEIQIGADEYTNSIIARGDSALFGTIDAIIAQLTDIRGGERVVTRVIRLDNLSAEDARAMIDDLQNARRGGSQSGGTMRRTGGTGGQSPVIRRQPTAPTRRRNPGGGGGSLRWQPPGAPADFAPPSALAVPPVVVAQAVLRPQLLAALSGALRDDLAQAEAVPADAADATGTEPQESASPAPGQASRPAAEGADGADGRQQPAPGVTGELRGQVAATVLDSKTLILTGDEQDIAFIQALLSAMETTAPIARIEVFALQKANAAALAPALEQAVQQMIEIQTRQPGPADRFVIVADPKSNSLIVSASEDNILKIEELISKLDVSDEHLIGFKNVVLTHARAVEAAARIRPIVDQLSKVRAVPAEAQPKIEPIDRSNSILIIGGPPDIEEIERLIKTVDVDIVADDSLANEFTVAEMIWIPIKNGSAEDIATALTDLIDREQQAAATGSESGRPGAPVLRKLRMTTADGRVLPEIDLEKPIRFLADKGTNSLIVFSSKKNATALTEVVGLFDALPIGTEIEVKSFALKNSDAQTVAELIQKVFDESKKALLRPVDTGTEFEKGRMPPIPPTIAGRGLPYDVTIAHDGRSNTVFVVGHKDAVLLAAGLITEMDRPNANLGMRTEVVSVRHQASDLAEKLNGLLEKRQSVLSKFEQNPERDNAIIVPDDRANLLIVMAPDDVFGMVTDLIRRIDEAPNNRIVETRYRALEFADANKLQAILQDLFDRKKEAEGNVTPDNKDVLYIIADARSNSLMLTGTRDYLDEAGKLLDNLDRRFDPTVEFSIRPIVLNSAANVAALLQEMVERQSQNQEKATFGTTPIYIAADPLSNNLILGASREDMVLLERWVEVLDKPSEFGRMTRIYPLSRLRAEEAAKSMEAMFAAAGAGGAAGGQAGAGRDVTVTFDATTNSVIAVAPPTILRDIEDALRRMDEVEITDVAITRSFKLTEADAEIAAEILQSILEGRSGTVGGTRGTGGTTGTGTRQEAVQQVMLLYQQKHPELGEQVLKAIRADIRVLADTRTNSLWITAPPRSMPLMESLVAAVDVPPDAAKIRIFPLRNADAQQMVDMLQALFPQATTAGGAGTGRPTTAGRAGEQERQLVLEGAGEGAGRQELAFTTDMRTNAVIAAGTKGALDIVEEIILELDTKPIQDRKNVVYTPRNNPAEGIAQALSEFSQAEQQRLQALGEQISAQQKMEREITAIANEDSNTVLISYDPRLESDVLDIVRELDQPPPQVMIEVLIVEVTLDNSLELGVEFAFQDLQFAKAGPSDTNTFDFVGGTDLGAAGSGLGGFTFTITGADFNFLIRTLQNEGSLEVLSRPMIMAMDNQEATFDVSNDVPYVSSTSTSTAGQVTTQVARQSVGIILTVTPQINPDGYVRMQIRQEVSDISGSTVDVGQGITAPIFFKRVADTTVTVMDNETVALGGLIRTRREAREQKVPLIGDIPLLGWAFRNMVETTERSELLIVLTPHVVRTVEDFNELSIAQRDRGQIISEDVLTNPLMNKLRVRPEELLEKHQPGEFIGPFEPSGADDKPEPPAEESYGPLRPARLQKQGTGEAQAATVDPNSYDLPLVRAPRR